METLLQYVRETCVAFCLSVHKAVEAAFHKHKCAACGTIWEHSNGCGGDVDSHACPKCDRMQWYKYFGEEDFAEQMNNPFAKLMMELEGNGLPKAQYVNRFRKAFDDGDK